MTYKEKRDHKFKILFMEDTLGGDLDSIVSNYFDNYPYEEDGSNQYIGENIRSHENINKVIIADEGNTDNESDKAVTISLSLDDDIRDINNKLRDIIARTSEIDEIIKSSLEGWDINRVGKAELVIIRLAVYEMYYDKEINIPIAINEAVELAKVYGDDKADKFVNGVLSTIYKRKNS